MQEKMSRWGVGPIFAALSIGYGMTAIAISNYFYPVFTIDIVPGRLLWVLGILLIVVGIPFFITSVITAMRAYNADELEAISKWIYQSVAFFVPANKIA